MSDTYITVVNVACFKCNVDFQFAGEFPYGFNAAEDRIACKPCAEKLGDRTMYYCWNPACRAQFQHLGTGWREPEGCSDECSYAIDEMVEQAAQRQYDYIERRLESL